MSKDLSPEDTIVFTCDECATELDTEIADEDEARQAMFDEDWSEERRDPANPDSPLSHFCPDCTRERSGEEEEDE